MDPKYVTEKQLSVNAMQLNKMTDKLSISLFYNNNKILLRKC